MSTLPQDLANLIYSLLTQDLSALQRHRAPACCISNFATFTSQFLALLGSTDPIDADALITSLQTQHIPHNNLGRILKQVVAGSILVVGGYDARVRGVLRRLLGIVLVAEGEKGRSMVLQVVERGVGEGVGKELNAKEEEQQKDVTEDVRKWVKVGLYTVAGGMAVAMTGGLAAPYLATGLGSLFASVGLTGATAAGLVGALGTASGGMIAGAVVGASGGLAAYKLAHPTLTEFYFRPLTPHPPSVPSLHLIIPISGHPGTISESVDPWETLPIYAAFSEIHCLIYESGVMGTLAKALEELDAAAVDMHGDSPTLPSMSAIHLSLVTDSPWTSALQHSKEAGLLLANQILVPALHGHRPVTLIGYTTGAYAIFHCLSELARRGRVESNVYGIIDSVYLLGAPIDIHDPMWPELRYVIHGRFVNAYCGGDWALRFLCRTANVAGLLPIEIPSQIDDDDNDITHMDSGIENVDISHCITTFRDFPTNMVEVLEAIGFERGKSRVQTGELLFAFGEDGEGLDNIVSSSPNKAAELVEEEEDVGWKGRGIAFGRAV
ncbi:hypothetical protein SpCBS45565_g08085 [Spizellomyces sp. 'palustris']|nr:hypothetical protein SpCBS45565_g08085 [Spizellomyces sp. 'palustris']